VRIICTGKNGDTDCGTLEQYQRHITTETMMGNAHAALSLLKLMQIPLGFLHFGSVSSCKYGYKFGYRHQFGLITVNYAKLLNDRHLWESDITLNYAYLS
jgi:hypothetical protein